MKKVFLQGLLAVLLITGLSGCATTHEVVTQYSRLTDFSGLKTYDWLADTGKISGEPLLDDAVIHEQIRGAVEIELSNKKYVKYTRGDPDFFIHYHVIVEDRPKPASRSRFYDDTLSWKEGLTPADPEIEEYRKGTLIIDIIDAKSKNLFWRGSTAAEIYPYAIPMQKIRQIKKGVKEIVAQFPPQ